MLIPELFRTIQDFSQSKVVIDWSLALQDEESQRAILEGLEVMQQALAFIANLDTNTRISFIGKASLLRSQLDFVLTMSQDEKRFFGICNEIEVLLKEIISYGSWLKAAQERYDAFVKYTEQQESAEHPEPDAEHMIFLQPVLLAIGTATVITFDQMENSEEGEDFNFEECDDECDDEHEHEEESRA